MQFNILNILVCACVFAAISFAQIVPFSDHSHEGEDGWEYVPPSDYLKFYSVVSVLKTALPTGLLTDEDTGSTLNGQGILDAAVSNLYDATRSVDWAPTDTAFPYWFSDLPSDVKRYLGAHPTAYATAVPTWPPSESDLENEGYSPSQVSEYMSFNSVMQTAVPASMLSEFIADPNSYAGLASVLDPDASTYPSWISALPSDVLTYFEIELETVPGATLIVPPPPTASVATLGITVTSTTLASITKPPKTTTTGGTTMTVTGTSGGGGGGVGGDVPGGAAAMPTVGMGAVVVVGLVGLLAL